MAKTFCIIYGLNEGPAMGRKLVKSFCSAGFIETTDPALADVIFGHSGGCLLIPPNNRATVILQVGVPYWPTRPWIVSTFIKVGREIRSYFRMHKFGYWLHKWSYHLIYAFNLPPAIRMAKNLKPSSAWNNAQKQIIVRNRYDAYSSPKILDITYRGPRAFISLPGEHDDCWDNPNIYVDLVKSLSK